MKKSVSSLGNTNLPFICLSGNNLSSVAMRKVMNLLLTSNCNIRLVRKRLMKLVLKVSKYSCCDFTFPLSLYLLRPNDYMVATDWFKLTNKLRKLGLGVSGVFIDGMLYYGLGNYDVFMNSNLDKGRLCILVLIRVFRVLLLSVFCKLRLNS